MFPQQKSVRYDRSIVLVAQQQFRMISALLKEKTEGVFHSVSERGGKKRWFEKKEGFFFFFPRKTGRGARGAYPGPSSPARDKLVLSLCFQEDEVCVYFAFTRGAEDTAASTRLTNMLMFERGQGGGD